jgi:hypothetical protein
MFRIFKAKTYPGKVLRTLVLTALVLFSVHVILKYVSIVMFEQKHGFLFELSNRFDVNDENSVPQWFSQIIFLLIGASAFLAARLQKVRSSRRLWLTIGIVGVVLSLDDVATLHEFILQSLHNTFFLDVSPTFLINAWWIFLPLVLVPAVFLAWWSWRVLPRRTVLLLVAGGVVFVAGKILMDSLANNVTDLFLESGLVQGVEKLFQYTGSSIVLYAVLDYLSAHHSTKIKKALAQLR